MLEMIQFGRASVNLGVDDPNTDEDVILVDALEIFIDSEKRVESCSTKTGNQDNRRFRFGIEFDGFRDLV